MDSVGFAFAIEKSDETGRYVRGWASVISVDGKPVTDTQGDVISMPVLRKAAHEFVTDARVAKVMHNGQRMGDVVESVLIDDEFAKAMGASTGKRGWWIGMDIHDPATRARVAKRELRAFSIGGRGVRQKIAD